MKADIGYGAWLFIHRRGDLLDAPAPRRIRRCRSHSRVMAAKRAECASSASRAGDTAVPVTGPSDGIRGSMPVFAQIKGAAEHAAPRIGQLTEAS